MISQFKNGEEHLECWDARKFKTVFEKRGEEAARAYLEGFSMPKAQIAKHISLEKKLRIQLKGLHS